MNGLLENLLTIKTMLAEYKIDENWTAYFERPDGLIKYCTPTTSMEDIKEFLNK